jgi:hypothetical protein
MSKHPSLDADGTVRSILRRTGNTLGFHVVVTKPVIIPEQYDHHSYVSV